MQVLIIGLPVRALWICNFFHSQPANLSNDGLVMVISSTSVIAQLGKGSAIVSLLLKNCVSPTTIGGKILTMGLELCKRDLPI